MSLGPAGSSAALTAARRTAEKILAQAKLGTDFLAERNDRQKKQVLAFGLLQGQFIDDAKSRLRTKTHSEWQRYLGDFPGRKKYLKALHSQAVECVTRAAIAIELDRIAKDNGPVTADRVKEALSAFFAWCVEAGYCTENPTIGISKRSKRRPRERILEDDELAEIWRHARDGDYGQIVRLLMLTGQRRDEISRLRVDEIDFENALLTLPPERVKNNRQHILPVSTQALAILKQAKPRDDRDFLFGGTGNNGYSAWSGAKERLDARINAERAKHETKNIPDWTVHDLRRTFASGMARLGVGLPVIEKMLNHVSGSFAGVVGIYQRHSFEKEMGEAMKLWGEHVEAITS